MTATFGRSGALILALLISFGSFSLAGCKGSPADNASGNETAAAPAGEEAASAAPAATEVPEEPAAAPSAITTARIEASENMVDWYQLHAEYAATGTRDEALDSAFAAKETALLAKKPAMPVNDKLELVAFDWVLDGSDSAEGKNENFTAHWLFRKTQETALGPDRRVVLVLRGWVDKAHQDYLKSDKNPEGRYFEKTYSLDPGIDAWETGKYHLISKEIRPAIPNLPYRMQSIFPQMKKKDDDSWEGDGRFAELLDMGWYADLGE